MLIIAIVAVAMIGVMIPSVFATSGTISLENDEFTLYGDGSVTIFSVTGEITDYIHRPMLEIIHNDTVIQTIKLHPIKNTLYSVIGLDKNWSNGEYFVNLKYQNKILDSKSFNIFRDNTVESKIIIHENMSLIIEPFLSVDTEKLIVNNLSDKRIKILGNIDPLNKYGSPVVVSLIKPDGTTTINHLHISEKGSFETVISNIDRSWISGKYLITANYLDTPQLSTSFVIENETESSTFKKFKLIGSFTVSSEISHEYTILGISGNVDTDESEMLLQIIKQDIIMFEDTLFLNDQLFETSTVLYDYTLNTPWEYGDYQIIGSIGDESFHSDSFTLDEQSFSIFNISGMGLFQNLEAGVQKLVDTDKIIISLGEEKQIILSGDLENYSTGTPVEVHLVNPDGIDSVSHLYASSSGSYYMPIIINDSWVSGSYTAYVTYGDFIDNPSLFEVVNNVILVKEIILEKEISEIILQELKNYSIILDNSQSVDSVHYTAAVNSYSGKVSITISLNDELLQEEFAYPSREGLIDYYLLLDEDWVSGDYIVSYVENNISTPFGTFEIFNNYIFEDIVEEVIVVEELSNAYLTLGQSMFKSSSHAVEYLQFSGKLVDDSTKKVSVSLDGNLQTVLPLDSGGNYAGVLSLGDLDFGFHNISIISGNTVESAEFLIATNHYISLNGDLEIFRNSIVESGGEISIFLSELVPNFVPSEIQPVIITVQGDDYYKKFPVMPKGYGFYSQNFMIDDSLGSYDVSVKYGGELIKSYSIDVLAIEPQWIKSQTSSWLNGEISDYSYFKKIVLMLDDDYTVTPNVTSPDWFFESADKWMNGLMDDDSFNDAILFLAENRLL